MQEHIHFWVIEKKEFFKIKLMIKIGNEKLFFFLSSNPNRKFFSSLCFYVSVPFTNVRKTKQTWNSLSKKVAETDTFSFWIHSFERILGPCFWSQNKRNVSKKILNCNGKLIRENSKVFDLKTFSLLFLLKVCNKYF